MIARHYLDALDAVPDDADAGEIRGQAIAALIRAAERAERTGAPAPAATSYATAAELTQADTAGGQQTAAAALWEHAAGAASPMPTGPRPSSMPSKAGDLYQQCGESRAAARAQAIAGRALRLRGRHARRASSSPRLWRCCGQTPTPTPSRPWASWRGWRCSPARQTRTRCPPRPSHSARPSPWTTGPSPTCSPLAGSATTTPNGGRRRPPISGRPPGWPAQAGEGASLGRALLNLSDAINGNRSRRRRGGGPRRRRSLAPGWRPRPSGVRDREPGAGAADDSATGTSPRPNWPRPSTPTAWPAREVLASYRAWLAALRGDTAAAQAVLAGLADLRASEDPQDQAIHRGRGGVHRRRPPPARRRAAPRPRRPRPGRRAWGSATSTRAVGVAAGRPRRPRPGRHRHHRRAAGLARRLPARAAGSHAARRTRPGPRPPHRRRRRPGSPALAFAAAITGLRQHSTPYHLAHGLLDHAEHLIAQGDAEAAAAAIGEARDIAQPPALPAAAGPRR